MAAALLEQLGLRTEPVGLLFSSGIASITAQLAALKAGKFFASLDPSAPIDRLSAQLEDLDSRALIYQRNFEELSYALVEQPEKRLSEESKAGTLGETRLKQVRCRADDPAHIVYTSGSTGVPLGVVHTHRSALHFFRNQTDCMRISALDCGTNVCPQGSAASMGEIFPILLNGGKLLSYSFRDSGFHEFVDLLQREGVTMCTFVPALFRHLAEHLTGTEDLSRLRFVRLSGDRVLSRDVELYQRKFPRNCLMRVSLGAAEAGLYTQFYIDHAYRPPGEVIPAGYALRGMTISIVDDDFNNVSDGTVGEIVVTSRYLADGYWRRPVETSERFTDSHSVSCARSYMTRDLGYLEPDGCLIHKGRKDALVKIYGKFVSISQVEEAMLSVPEVTDAVVVVTSSATAAARLVAFYTCHRDMGISPANLRAALLKLMPAESVPRMLMPLSSLPVTPSNKIDRLALTKMAGGNLAL